MQEKTYAERIIETAEDFQKELDDKKDKKDRFLSWVHCYRRFSEIFKKPNLTEENIDYLALNLAFYLASWGMYRGSSFLLQKDYTIHKDIVKELYEFKFLQGISCYSLENELETGLVQIVKKINNNYLRSYQEFVKEKKGDKQIPKKISNTLITKILMGTLGCTPAYDRYFVAGIKSYDCITNRSFNEKSLKELIDFYKDNNDELEKFRAENSNRYQIDYPQMKLLDLIFWKAGYDIEDEKRKSHR